MVCFDASVLIDIFNPLLTGPRKQRIDALMVSLGKEKIVIPAPAYIEFLTRADKAREQYHILIEANKSFKVEPLSKRAAVECAIILDTVFSAKQKKEVTRTKLKFDWMIVAIAKTLSQRCVYTSDTDILNGCKHAGLNCVLVDSILIPPPAPTTMSLPFDDPAGGFAEAS